MEEQELLKTPIKEEQQTKHFPILKIVIFFVILLIIYAICTSRFLIKVKEYSITDSNLPTSFDGLKIVQISDLHYGTSIKEFNLKMIVKKVNELKPDIIVFNGDLIDQNTEHSAKIKSELTYHLSTLEAKEAKIAIKGDNDTEDYTDLLTSSGFTYLSDEAYPIYSNTSEVLNIIGLNSTTNLKTDTYQIALIHEPDKIDNLLSNNYNLVLAGHSHGGEIRLPFIGGLVNYNGATKYKNREYDLNSTKMYITDGLGTSIINLRLGTTPTINFYRLYQY